MSSQPSTAAVLVFWAVLLTAGWLWVRNEAEVPASDADAGSQIAIVWPGDMAARDHFRTKSITPATFASSWPFTVDRATLVCLVGKGGMGKFVLVDGQPFAATGAAQSFARRHGLAFVVDNQPGRAPRPLDVDDREAARLWAEAPRPEGLDPVEPWHRVSVGPVIAALDALGCDG